MENEDTRKRNIRKFLEPIQKYGGRYVGLLFGSLVLALLNLVSQGRFEDFREVLTREQLALRTVVYFVIGYVLGWVVRKTAQWCDQSGRNWEWWIIAAGLGAGICAAPLMYLLEIYLDRGWANGVISALWTFFAANLVCLTYTFMRYYLEGRNSFFFKDPEG